MNSVVFQQIATEMHSRIVLKVTYIIMPKGHSLTAFRIKMISSGSLFTLNEIHL
ncbi:hypothetical protein VDIAB_250229 [Vibrio diabolicus]|nr:hypothetical protein VDIAB_250229 [Vibrio diabolicus]